MNLGYDEKIRIMLLTMSTIDLQNKFQDLKDSMDEEQRKLFPFNSVQNFLIYYDDLTPDHQAYVQKLLIEYFKVLEDQNLSSDEETSTRLVFDYILKIGKYYTVDVGFKARMTLRSTIVIGILIDFLLLLLGLLKIVYYLPIVTLIMLCDWSYIKWFYERRNKVFGLRY